MKVGITFSKKYFQANNERYDGNGYTILKLGYNYF